MTSVGSIKVVDINYNTEIVTALSNKLELKLYFAHGIPPTSVIFIFNIYIPSNKQKILFTNVYSIVNSPKMKSFTLSSC